MTVPSSHRAPLIVVGVDGSPGSQHALDFAVAEAELRGAAVRAVCTWDFPLAYGAGVIVPFEEVEAGARVVVADAITLATKDAPSASLPVTAVLRQGHASEELVAEAQDATLLVVGSRGHGGFVGLLIGSISQGCVTHAPCPVVVVPARPLTRAGDARTVAGSGSPDSSRSPAMAEQQERSVAAEREDLSLPGTERRERAEEAHADGGATTSLAGTERRTRAAESEADASGSSLPATERRERAAESEADASGSSLPATVRRGRDA